MEWVTSLIAILGIIAIAKFASFVLELVKKYLKDRFN